MKLLWKKRLSDTNFFIGSFGKNHQMRKITENKFDRFPDSELVPTIKNIKQSFKASNDPSNYRIDNIVHIAEMPNGEKRAIYTRKNKNEQNEIIAWHVIDKTKEAKYLDTLASYGIPSGN